MNLRIITKNHAADPEIGFLTKSISKPSGRATAMPTAWELIKFEIKVNYEQFEIKFRESEYLSLETVYYECSYH